VSEAIAAPQPLYRTVKDFITRRIAAREWLPGARVPSEMALVETLGVSRMTVHRALRELAVEGRLTRIQGVGTFVAPPAPQSTLLEIRDIAEDIGGRGGRHSARVVTLAEAAAGAEIAAAMRLAPGRMLYHSVLVHYENDRPVQIEERWVNPLLAPDYLAQDFRDQTPGAYLLDRVKLTEVEHVVEATMPDAARQALLAMSGDEPCLVLNRRTWSNGDIAMCASFVHPASRYRITAHFRTHGPPGRGLA
jgi:GntR family transcriptional regulator, histidine utilization repressor